MANERYEGVGLDGHYTLAERIFTKIKNLFDTKVKTDVPANAKFTDHKSTVRGYFDGMLVSETVDKVDFLNTDFTVSPGITVQGSSFSTVSLLHPVETDVPSNAVFTDTLPMAYCDTNAGTTAKVAKCTNFSLKNNSFIPINFKNGNTVASGTGVTLNINNTGAKPVYVDFDDDSVPTDEPFDAGTYILYYTNQAYYLYTNGVLYPYRDVAKQNDLRYYSFGSQDGSVIITEGSSTSGGATTYTENMSVQKVNGHTVNSDVPNNAVFTDEKVKQTESTDDKNYEVLVSGTASTATTTEGANKSTGFRYNPSKKAVMEGSNTTASGNYSHAEGGYTKALGQHTHAEGYGTTASGSTSHSEGYNTKASGAYSHVEGFGSSAAASYAHAEGYKNIANGEAAHAEGSNTSAPGYYSHTEGYKTVALNKSQHVFGEFNILDNDPYQVMSDERGKWVEIVGNGNSVTRSNARTLDWDGNEEIAGNLTDKWGLQTSRDLFQSEFDNLTQEERDNGTTYYIKDGEPLRICDYIYPVGAIYMSVNNISPAILFGGTWERIKDTFLLAAGDDYNAGSTGGEAEHTLTTDEIPAHTHGNKSLTGTMNPLAWAGSASESGIVSGRQNHTDRVGNSGSNWGDRTYTINASHEHNSVGLGYAHNNMPPYLTVYMWKRVPDPEPEEENNEEQGE